ncbi:hypothetical protein ACU686_29720 [Yinghuangia aomiensis]
MSRFISDWHLDIRDRPDRSTELDIAIDPGEREVRLSLDLNPEIYLSPEDALKVADSLTRAARSIQAAAAGDTETYAQLWPPAAE